MNSHLKDLLSVKTAVERTVQAYLASYAKSGDQGDLYNDICRYMAVLFASKQINRDYLVGIRTNSLEVKFSTGNRDPHFTNLTFVLPKHMVPKTVDDGATIVSDFVTQHEHLPVALQRGLDDNKWDLYVTSNQKDTDESSK